MEIYENKYLTGEDEIEEHFTDIGPEFFDCGQGYYENDTTVVVKINDQYYDVTMGASIESSKQDRGDRLYWVDCIETVKFVKIIKADVVKRQHEEIQSKITAMEARIVILKQQLAEL